MEKPHETPDGLAEALPHLSAGAQVAADWVLAHGGRWTNLQWYAWGHRLRARLWLHLGAREAYEDLHITDVQSRLRGVGFRGLHFAEQMYIDVRLPDATGGR